MQKVRKGYDPVQVDALLSKVILDLENSQDEIDKLKNEIERLNSDNKSLKEQIEQCGEEIKQREKALDELNRIALREANLIVQAAQKNANSIVEEALTSARFILQEIARIEAEAYGVRDKVKILGSSLVDVAENFELPDLPYSKNKK